MYLGASPVIQQVRCQTMENAQLCRATARQSFPVFPLSMFSACSFSIPNTWQHLVDCRAQGRQDSQGIGGSPGKEQQPSHSTLTTRKVLHAERVEGVMEEGHDLSINTLFGSQYLHWLLAKAKSWVDEIFFFWPTTPHRVYQMLHCSWQSQLAPRNLHHHCDSKKCVRRKQQQGGAVTDWP